MPSFPERPSVLCAAGHDPSGGAGIQADAQAILAAGAHPLTVITCLTSQDTCHVRRLWPQPHEQVAEQCQLLMDDSSVTAIKIGLIGSSRIVRALCDVLDNHPDLPVILDPILASGSGQTLADAALLNQIRTNLIPRCTLVTPNLHEARALGAAEEPQDCAASLLKRGCTSVLITGTHAEDPEVTNRFYRRDGRSESWTWPRLPGDYHGSGCTLSSAIAARMALGMSLVDAIAAAQDYTWNTLKQAYRSGHCQITPNRLFMLDTEQQGHR